MKTSGERFQFWVTNVVGVSIVTMAETLGVEHRTLYNVVNNQNKTIIGKKTLTLLKKRYPKFPWGWVRTGIGDTPGYETVEFIEEGTDMSAESRIKDMEVEALRKEIDGLRGLVDAAENNNKRLENLIVHYEKMYNDCREQLERNK